jgi:hypothetical protein
MSDFIHTSHAKLTHYMASVLCTKTWASRHGEMEVSSSRPFKGHAQKLAQGHFCCILPARDILGLSHSHRVGEFKCSLIGERPAGRGGGNTWAGRLCGGHLWKTPSAAPFLTVLFRV